MGLPTRIAVRLLGLARLLENPRLLKLRRHGGVLGTYLSLNQPWLTSQGIATVLDIGAHTGLFSVTINTVFPKARIYAFEPQPDCFEKLQARLQGVPGCAALNVALGEQSGPVAFERSSFSPSSSCLRMAELHKTLFPHTARTQTASVAMERLDTVAQTLDIRDPVLIKMDVQGYEDRVLRGGAQTVQRARVLLVETSFLQLYEGQALFADVHDLLRGWGFRYAGSLDQLPNPQTGEALQQDSIFVKAD
ncbi:MAG: FkbM family methyltransferase [Planctomycetota bacterium]